MDSRIPKAAVEPLALHCVKVAEPVGRRAEEVFREFLVLMKKHAKYFFGDDWPVKVEKPYGLGDAELDFLGGAGGYVSERERFLVVCLRRNMSLEGFDGDGFDEDFGFYGKLACGDCVVDEAVRLRDHVKRVELAVKEAEEAAKSACPGLMAVEVWEHYRQADVVRENRKMLVELRVYEEFGWAEGKRCVARNKYKCPYGRVSEQLIRRGELAKAIWRLVDWYNFHWNRSRSFEPGASSLKWYHYDEPGFLDVTSYEDVAKAVNDGRLERIMKERERFLAEAE